MIYAYFNDCLPRGLAVKAYSMALENTARGFKRLCDNFSGCDDALGGVITNSEMSRYALDGNAVTLEQCIKDIDDRDMRNLLVSWMTNYPETMFFQEEVDDEAILNENYHLTYGADQQNAINLILAKYHGAFLFSLNLHKVLGGNEVKVQGESENVPVNNLYGNEDENVAFITQFVNEAYRRTLSTHRQIEPILQNFVKHKVYDAEYSKLSVMEQTSILDTWKVARDKNLLSPFMPDNDVIKKTEGPEKQEKKLGSVFELRVRKPKELRVYFQFVDDTYFLLDIGDETHQSIDIKNAFAKANSLRK